MKDVCSLSLSLSPCAALPECRCPGSWKPAGPQSAASGGKVASQPHSGDASSSQGTWGRQTPAYQNQPSSQPSLPVLSRYNIVEVDVEYKGSQFWSTNVSWESCAFVSNNYDCLMQSISVLIVIINLIVEVGWDFGFVVNYFILDKKFKLKLVQAN